MASEIFLPPEDLTCPVCHDIFNDPVILLCSHSFCKACLQEYWKHKVPRGCPVCRKATATVTDPPSNLALKNVCKALSTGSKQFCSQHSEKLIVFCLEDQEPICLVCQTSRKHGSHTFARVEEAARVPRKQLQMRLKSFKKKMVNLTSVKQICDETAKFIETQRRYTERQIVEEFKKLHYFLREEEEARIVALWEEEEEKSKKMKEKTDGMKREMESLLEAIGAMEEDLRAEDIVLLQNLQATKEKTQIPLPHPELVSEPLIDVAKHLGNLTFRVWEKMKDMVKHSPVILDPNTASSWLSLSDDLTRVGRSDTRQQVPKTPERSNHFEVQGSEGFNLGKHSWEVEVGDHPRWTIGVRRESDIKSLFQDPIPENGFWVICQSNGELKLANGDALTLEKRPQRIRVQLDYDKGELFFSDSKNMTPIYTFKDNFFRKLFPYFCLPKSDTGKTTDLHICQSEVSLTLISHK